MDEYLSTLYTMPLIMPSAVLREIFHTPAPGQRLYPDQFCFVKHFRKGHLLIDDPKQSVITTFGAGERAVMNVVIETAGTGLIDDWRAHDFLVRDSDDVLNVSEFLVVLLDTQQLSSATAAEYWNRLNNLGNVSSRYLRYAQMKIREQGGNV